MGIRHRQTFSNVIKKNYNWLRDAASAVNKVYKIMHEMGEYAKKFIKKLSRIFCW